MKLLVLDKCLPDYFQGCEYPYMAIPIDNTTTYRELRQAIVEDYQQDYYQTYPDNLDMEKLANDMLSNVWNGAIRGVSMDSPIDPDLPENDMDSVYIYIALKG